MGIVVHDIIIRYGESIWPRTSSRQTEFNTWIGNLEPDLLAREGGWRRQSSSCRAKWSKWDNACQCFLLYMLICLSLINPQGWYLQFRWNVNSFLYCVTDKGQYIIWPRCAPRLSILHFLLLFVKNWFNRILSRFLNYLWLKHQRLSVIHLVL